MEDDIKMLLRVAHIPPYHYAECMFNIAFLSWTERLEWMWDMYCGMREHNIVGPYRGEAAQPIILLNAFFDDGHCGIHIGLNITVCGGYVAWLHNSVRIR